MPEVGRSVVILPLRLLNLPEGGSVDVGLWLDVLRRSVGISWCGDDARRLVWEDRDALDRPVCREVLR